MLLLSDFGKVAMNQTKDESNLSIMDRMWSSHIKRLITWAIKDKCNGQESRRGGVEKKVFLNFSSRKAQKDKMRNQNKIHFILNKPPSPPKKKQKKRNETKMLFSCPPLSL